MAHMFSESVSDRTLVKSNNKSLSRTIVRLTVKIIITVTIFYYLFSRLNISSMLSLVLKSNLVILALSFVLFVSRNIFGALRNRVLLQQKGYDFAISKLTRFYFIGFFFNLFLPSVVGGDIARGYYLYKYSGGKEETISTIFVERALGILAMMFLSLLSVIVALIIGIDILSNDVISFIFIIFFTGLIVSMLFFNKRTERYLLKLIPSSFSDKFSTPINVIRNVLNFNKAPGTLLHAFSLSIMFQLFTIISTYMISVSIGGETSFLYFLILLPVIWIVSMVPISINGLGLREGTFIFLFSSIGMSKEMAMTISILWLTQTIALGLLGGLFFVHEGSRISAIKEYR